MSQILASQSAPKFRRHRPWLVLSIITSIVAIAGVIAVTLVKQHSREHIGKHLQLVLDGTAVMIDYSFQVSARQTEALAADPKVHSIFHEAIANPHEGGTLLRQFMIDRLDGIEILGLALLSATGQVVASSEDRLALDLPKFRFEGKPPSPPGASAIKFSLPLQLTDISTRQIEMGVALSAPLHTKTSGTVVSNGSLWVILDANHLPGTFLQAGRSGTTGELYAFDRNGLMISNSRFNEQLRKIGLLAEGETASLNLSIRDPQRNLLIDGGQKGSVASDQLPLTHSIASAVRGQSGINLNGFRDYRGVPVVGAWRWLDTYGFGLVHEVDVSEAFFHVTILELVVLGLVVLLLVATIVAGVYSWRVARIEEINDKSEERVKQLNSQIAHVNRLATMGEMATGLAHEINQPLSAISNFSRALINDLDRPEAMVTEKTIQRLKRIESNALRAGEIIHRMRRFVSHREVKMQALDLRHLALDPLEALATEIHAAQIDASTDFPVNLPKVRGDEIQLQQVLVNLMRNAIEAMDQVLPANRKLVISAFTSDENVCLSVTDSGPGILPEIRERLFEQFNTSNPQGMGLGLAISKTIIEAHHGQIQVDSSQDIGTRFLITLPAIPG